MLASTSFGYSRLRMVTEKESVCFLVCLQMIQAAMRMAISDGLSESVIMEVIDDVTKLDTSKSDTPRRRAQLAKVDMNRAPRNRPDQLAIGFNYHSDIVVKESPKTVNGQIIPLETLPEPKPRVEQLAVGFNYLAQELVKNSPRNETGEPIIPGVITTPRRRTRDQLAIGFSYHAEEIAKENPCIDDNEECGENKENLPEENRSTSPDLYVAKDTKQNSGKRLFSDTVAVGFSYNSDFIMEQGLSDIVDSTMSEKFVTELVEDATLGEGRNVVETDSENIHQVGLPAGSVW